MNTIFMNSRNSKISDPHRLLLNLTNRIDLKRKDKYIALSNLSTLYTWKNIEWSYKNNKCKILAPIWNEELKLPNGLCSLSDIQDYVKYIFKKHGKKTVKPSIRIYIRKIENRITFEIKTGYCIELLTPETMKLLGSTKRKIR